MRTHLATANEKESLAMNRAPQPSSGLSIEEFASGSTRVLHFEDKRPPREIKHLLEQELTALFTATMEHETLYLRAKAKIVGADYRFCLSFEAASLAGNRYALRMDVSWPEQANGHADYYRKNSASWFALWTRDFLVAGPPMTHENSPQIYSQLCRDALDDERHLDSVAAIQQAIVAAFKSGATYRTSHKEGGTKIYWSSNRFVRSDYGDNPDEQRFTNETEFLNMLRRFCDWDVTRNSSGETAPEIDTWRLILRRLTPH